MNYNNLTRQHFESAANAGTLSGPGTRQGSAGVRAQGTFVRFDVQIDSSNHGPVLAAVRFLAYGCPHVIAVCDWLAQFAVGMDAKPALPESVAALRERFEVPVEKLGRLLIVEDAWIAALAPPYL
jgi:NifU-like protein involved in Fe-S cluster formation